MSAQEDTAQITLTGFLEKAADRLHFYDMGRRVTPIPRKQFLAFEETTEPYPYPMQQQAWFAIIQEYPLPGNEPLIWFLRFDLDEQARLVLATRDYLIHRFIEISSQKSQDIGEAEADLGLAMRDNPYAFTPREDKMANLHARVHRDLGLPPSGYYAHARDYLSGRPGWGQWRFVGYQGLADIAARQDQQDNATLLAEAIPQLPTEPLVALCQCLEHYRPGGHLVTALQDRLRRDIADCNTPAAVLAALLRGQCQAPPKQLADTIVQLLNDPRSSDPEILAAIGGRAWEALRYPQVIRAYLERLASEAVDQEIFNHCVGDLLRLPQTQAQVRVALRAEDRSSRLASAFQTMLDGH